MHSFYPTIRHFDTIRALYSNSCSYKFPIPTDVDLLTHSLMFVGGDTGMHLRPFCSSRSLHLPIDYDRYDRLPFDDGWLHSWWYICSTMRYCFWWVTPCISPTCSTTHHHSMPTFDDLPPTIRCSFISFWCSRYLFIVVLNFYVCSTIRWSFVTVHFGVRCTIILLFYHRYHDRFHSFDPFDGICYIPLPMRCIYTFCSCSFITLWHYDTYRCSTITVFHYEWPFWYYHFYNLFVAHAVFWLCCVCMLPVPHLPFLHWIPFGHLQYTTPFTFRYIRSTIRCSFIPTMFHSIPFVLPFCSFLGTIPFVIPFVHHSVDDLVLRCLPFYTIYHILTILLLHSLPDAICLFVLFDTFWYHHFIVHSRCRYLTILRCHSTWKCICYSPDTILFSSTMRCILPLFDVVPHRYHLPFTFIHSTICSTVWYITYLFIITNFTIHCSIHYISWFNFHCLTTYILTVTFVLQIPDPAPFWYILPMLIPRHSWYLFYVTFHSNLFWYHFHLPSDTFHFWYRWNHSTICSMIRYPVLPPTTTTVTCPFDTFYHLCSVLPFVHSTPFLQFVRYRCSFHSWWHSHRANSHHTTCSFYIHSTISDFPEHSWLPTPFCCSFYHLIVILTVVVIHCWLPTGVYLVIVIPFLIPFTILFLPTVYSPFAFSIVDDPCSSMSIPFPTIPYLMFDRYSDTIPTIVHSICCSLLIFWCSLIPMGISIISTDTIPHSTDATFPDDTVFDDDISPTDAIPLIPISRWPVFPVIPPDTLHLCCLSPTTFICSTFYLHIWHSYRSTFLFYNSYDALFWPIWSLIHSLLFDTVHSPFYHSSFGDAIPFLFDYIRTFCSFIVHLFDILFDTILFDFLTVTIVSMVYLHLPVIISFILFFVTHSFPTCCSHLMLTFDLPVLTDTFSLLLFHDVHSPFPVWSFLPFYDLIRLPFICSLEVLIQYCTGVRFTTSPIPTWYISVRCRPLFDTFPTDTFHLRYPE